MTELATISNWESALAGTLQKGRVRRSVRRRLFEVRSAGYRTKCWIWVRALTPTGYPSCYVPETGRMKPAHRVFFRSKFGEIPRSLELDHLCRNRSCVNPDHMEAVTRAENNRRRGCVKLSMQKALEIRRLRNTGLKIIVLARKFDVSESCIDAVVNHRTWNA